MKVGTDIASRFPGITIVYHNKPGDQRKDHMHEETELFLPLQGEIAIEIVAGEEVITASPGRMIIIPPSTGHRFRSGRAKGERLIALIDRRAWQKYGGPDISPAAYSTNQLLKEILFHLLVFPKSKAVDALIAALLQTLTEIVVEPKSPLGMFSAYADFHAQHPCLEKALAILRSEFSTPPSLDLLAKRSGTSVRNLNRLFAKELGIRPKEYLTRIRIDEARTMLQNQSVSVTEAALAVGYNSLSQFIQTFRRLTGILPSDVGRFGHFST